MQFAREGQNVGVSLVRLARQGLHDHALDARAEVQIGTRLVQRDGSLGQELREHLARTLREVRQRARQQQIGDRGQGVLIRCRRHQLARQRLGRHVHEGSDEVTSAGKALVLSSIRCSRNAEVEQLGGVRDGIVHRVVGF